MTNSLIFKLFFWVPFSLPCLAGILLVCPIHSVDGQTSFLTPTETQKQAFLNSSDEIKLAIYEKLFILEHATIENGNIKLSMPVLTITILKDGSVLQSYDKPFSLLIGNEKVNLNYDFILKPEISVAKIEYSGFTTIHIVLASSISFTAGLIAGYLIGQVGGK